MITQARTARPAIILDGDDYYNKLAPYFVSLEYTDNCDGEKADDLTIELGDRDKRFINDWSPAKGAFVDVSIIAERWFALNSPKLTLDCGRFWIDSIEFEMPDNKVTIKASSLPTTAHIKGSNETRGWEKSSLRDIAQQVAKENGMSVDYQSNVNPRYARIEQNEESALTFLKKLAKDAKLSIKVHRNAIVMFDEETYEAAAAKFTVIYGNGPAAAGVPCYRMSGGHFETKLTDTIKKAKLRHTKLATGQVTTGDFSVTGSGDGTLSAGLGFSFPLTSVGTDTTPPSSSGSEPPEGSAAPDPAYGDPADITQNVNEDPGEDDSTESESDTGGTKDELESWKLDNGSAAGTRKAKSVARDANKDKETASIDLGIGNPLIAAGMTFNLVGVGKFDGKWFVTSAQHKVGPSYETSLEIRRCLEGY
jgi:phage protein D